MSMFYNSQCEDSMPPALSVASSNCSAMDTLVDDVDSLWDDVRAMRREFSAILDDVYDTKEDVTNIQNAVVEQSEKVERQGPITAQLHSSVTLLRDEVGSMSVQMSILKEKNQKMECMLAFLMKTNPEVQQIYESMQEQTQHMSKLAL